MNEKKQWVQHISGQGDKWVLVYGGDPIDWLVLCRATDGQRNRSLPKSEYRLCDPPEVWKDVTGECEINRNGDVLRDGKFVSESTGYRFIKVPIERDPKQWSFIVEQKVTE